MTTKLEQAARQALDALENSRPDGDDAIAVKRFFEAITALREVLAEQAEQEPVKVTGAMVYAFHHALTDGAIGAGEFDEIKLGLEAAFVSITIPIEPVKQEPVAWWDGKETAFFEHELYGLKAPAEFHIPLYAAPVRTKDLTDDEIAELFGNEENWTCDRWSYERAVIAADREKNK